MQNFLLLTLLATTISACQPQMNFLDNLFRSNAIPDTKYFKKEYDFIIIGAGSGGSVMANRLSKNIEWSVLLLEAGQEENMLSDIPLAAPLGWITSFNWGYRADPMERACQAFKDGVCTWPKGRALGGTSVINYLIYTRGNRRDYDGWAELGNHGWSFDEILPYFKKSENIQIDSLKFSPYHGHDGPVDIENSGYFSQLYDAFVEAGKIFGYWETDPSGESQLGFSKAQATMRNGKRCSAAKAYLKPVQNRKNLEISINTWVTKILIDPVTRRAYGVEVAKNKKRYFILASKEIILSAGAIASPQLLMLSGIGPKSHLQSLGIPVLQDLKVGYNLQDHVMLPGLTFTVDKPATFTQRELQRPLNALQYFMSGTGPLTVPGGADGIAFVKTNISFSPPDYPDIELVMGLGALSSLPPQFSDVVGLSEEFIRKTYGSIQYQNAFSVIPLLLRPKSRGRISLKSTNPFHWPRMQGNYLEDDDDLLVLREGIKLTIDLVLSGSFNKFGIKLHKTPFYGCEHLLFGSDEYWDCCLRLLGSSLNHQSCTNKMGPAEDPDAVVDPQLQVHGIKHLRVVDASIFPVIPASHTNAVVFMVAEKAADMVKQYWESEV